MENLTEIQLRILHSMRLIVEMNEAIEWQKAQEEPSQNSIQNAMELKSRYAKELFEILRTELDIHIPVAA